VKFTPSSKFIALANGSAKEMKLRAYVRKVTDLSIGLNDGSAPWTEVTDWIEPPQDIKSRIEYETGQFAADKIKIKAHDISYWKDNWFDATDVQYLEMKVEAQITGASDIVPMFAGFIDKAEVSYKEIADSIECTAYTAEDLGTRLPAELVSAQPIQSNADGANDGLILPTMTGIYVMDANIASYVLQPGTHTLTYTSSGTKIRLDDGSDTPISVSNTYPLVNGDGTQKVKIYVQTLPASDAADDIVVVNAGDTLPKRWYKDVNVQLMLTKLYQQLGLRSVQFDTLEANTYDGEKRLMYIDVPPENTSYIVGATKVIETDGADLFIAIDNHVYKRDRLLGTYTLLCDALSIVDKMVYNARNNHLWLYIRFNGIQRYDLTSGSLSSIIYAGTDWHSFEVFDYNYTGTSWYYGVLVAEIDDDTKRGSFREVNGSSLNITSIVTGATLGYNSGKGIKDYFMYQMGSGKVRFRVLNNSNLHAYREYQLNSSATWIDNGEKLGAGIPDYRQAAYHTSEGRIYFQDPVYHKIQTHTDSSIAITDVLDGGVVALDSIWYCAPENKIYFCLEDSGPQVYTAASNTATLFFTNLQVFENGFVYGNSRLYLIDWIPVNGAQLKQYSSKIVFSIPLAMFTDKAVTSELRNILKDFGLIGKISATKKAYVYRRGDDSGVPQTTGNTLSVTVDEASSLEETEKSRPKFDIVELSNGIDTVTYNGTAFNVAVLSDKRKLTRSSEYLPSAILKDLAYYMFQFFNVDRDLYPIELGNVTRFEFEPFDNCSVTFTTTKIQKTASGPIYAATYGVKGTLSIEVLL